VLSLLDIFLPFSVTIPPILMLLLSNCVLSESVLSEVFIPSCLFTLLLSEVFISSSLFTLQLDDGEIFMVENNSLLQSAEKSHDVEQTREILKHNSNNETTLKPVREGFVERSSKDQPHIALVRIKSSEKLSNKRTSNNSVPF
jgi:hypothetical protein